ncbi:MAG TPA: adenosylcobinamide-GDP ribazoletransferase [Bacilli bacterium]|nr:adenosylcobinamide-GDP ribazoletransferase [Bacilli bacterium]
MKGTYLDPFWYALSFLTRFPAPSRDLSDEAWKKSTSWYPFVGLLLGGALVGVAWTISLLAPPLLVAVLVVTAWVVLTGGLHLDGWMDTADGFGSHRPRERVLEIMKDSRVGAMGVLAALLLLGNKVAALAAVDGERQLACLLLAPVLGRAAMLVALAYLPSARADGLGQSLRSAGKRVNVWAWGVTVLVLLFAGFWLSDSLIPALLLAALFAWLLLRTSLRKIGGCTGDVYGALCEGVEAAVLLGVALS